MNTIKFIVIVVLLLKCVYGAKILGVFPLDWGSHYILGTKLMKGLAEAGHDVTIVYPHKYNNLPENGSWTDVLLDGNFGENFKQMVKNVNLNDDQKKSSMQQMKGYLDMLLTTANQTLTHPNMQKLLHSNSKFDAVIIENIMNECHHVLAYHFKCPLIILSSIGANAMINSKVGNPSPVSTVANINSYLDPSKEMTMIQRLKNLGNYMMYNFFSAYFILPPNAEIVRQLFPDAPDMKDLYYNTSLVLLNSHYSITQSVPMVPNMVEVGGYFIDAPKKLPQDLQDFLDSAKDGAIYFSMGSTLKSKDFPEDKLKPLLEAFKKLKQKIVWKFEEELPGKPDNILIKNWLPQQDILAHPNVKLFITHGGLLSTIEAVYHGVPLLSIPVFGDQFMNALKTVQNGYGLQLAYHDEHFNEQKLTSLIQELLNNPTYKETAQRRSKIYHDRPLTPMQTVVYWVEYVIRHRGAPHLRVAGLGMPWYKYLMLDVLGVVICSLLLGIFVIRLVFKKLSAVLFGKTKKAIKSKTN